MQDVCLSGKVVQRFFPCFRPRVQPTGALRAGNGGVALVDSELHESHRSERAVFSYCFMMVGRFFLGFLQRTSSIHCFWSTFLSHGIPSCSCDSLLLHGSQIAFDLVPLWPFWLPKQDES